MSRYIDADKLVRVMCHHCTEYEQCTDKNGGCDDFDMLMIAHAPTADVVKPIRCEACKHYIIPDDGRGYCGITRIIEDPRGYCSHAKEGARNGRD